MGLGFYNKTNRVGLTTNSATADYYGHGTPYEVLNNNPQRTAPIPAARESASVRRRRMAGKCACAARRVRRRSLSVRLKCGQTV
jgi:hypothetical protein